MAAEPRRAAESHVSHKTQAGDAPLYDFGLLHERLAWQVL
eukprot:CAMPEP_0202065368 /NCGR_PEP_ID=MMETSP0963-20130614/51422_1 /ASSEMBLY_ACC=CAM_ASM_000494 /TAXON_ID=4773 /ORGANISM="Schizochytrium aggregatum, Strain ATCC28209" /LENGTH=39 /DNA_ID= /DNA_START= /DNA_END= /DNA_ORIENTATION=